MNEEMIEYWNTQAGPAWVCENQQLDAQLAPIDEVARQRAALCHGERVLDVGCGCGATAIWLAGDVGPRGRVTAIDVSKPMLDVARQRARAGGMAGRIDWVEADAQTCELGTSRFDCVYSRMGVMFFSDPVAAFINLGRALKSGGRVVFTCWQAKEKNPWMTVPVLAVKPYLELPPSPDPNAPGPFAFADDRRVRSVLEAAGLVAIAFESVDQPIALGGGDLDRAVQLALRVGPVAAAVRNAALAKESEAMVIAAVRAALASFPDLQAPAAAWVVMARKP